MSGLGELLLGKVERSSSPKKVESKNNNIDESEKGKPGHQIKHIKLEEGQHDSFEHKMHSGNTRKQGRVPNRIERTDKDEDNQSNASSTDDYVRELLDPNDRPRNVWHVVEGPKDSPDSERGHQDRVKDEQGSYDDRYRSSSSSLRKEANKNDSPEQQKSPQSDYNTRQYRERSKLPDEVTERNDHHSDRDADELDRDQVYGRPSSRHRDGDRIDTREGDYRERSHNRDSERDRSTSRHRSSHRRDYSDEEDLSASKRRRGGRSGQGRKRSPSRSTSRSPDRYSSRRRRDRSRSNSPRRNARTVIIMQLSQRVDKRDLEDFFGDEIGNVREVRLIMDSRTRRHKGVAYIEFNDSRSASRALSLNGKKLHGVSLIIQAVNHSKGSDPRSSSTTHHASRHHISPSSPSRNQTTNHRSSTTHPSSRSLPPNAYRVYIGALHLGITDEMLRTIVEPFGPIIRLELIKDRATGASRGYAFITYANVDDGQEAVKCLDGFELAGKNMRVSKSTEKGEH